MTTNNHAPREFGEYYLLTAKQQRDKALHTLDGILTGVRMDHVVNQVECEELKRWLDNHAFLAPKDSVLAELVATVRQAIADGVLTEDEREDIKHLLTAAKWGSKYYKPVTHAAQELQGVLHGLIADQVLNDKEIVGLRNLVDGWMEKHPGLIATWPFTEVSAALTHVLKDRRIDPDERAHLLRLFSMFSGFDQSHPDDGSIDPLFLQGICAVQPEIEFESRVFCFTGKSKKWVRADFATAVTQRGGVFVDTVRNDINYLVVGTDANPCWAFSCYGRKVEWVMNQRRSGKQILIVHESDFADALF